MHHVTCLFKGPSLFSILIYALPQSLSLHFIYPKFVYNIMAASVPENWACINGDDDEFDQFKVNDIDGDLLMSFLEELHGEECDDERLTNMIQSLEAEINPIVMDGHDLPMHNSDSCQPSDAAQVDGQDCSVAHDLDLHWMHVEMAPASPSDEMTNWYMDPCGDEFDAIIEFGGVRDHSQNLYGVVHLEELSYGSLWQETHIPQ